MGFSKNPLLDPWNPRWLRSAILKIDMMSFFSAERGPIWIKFHGAEWHVDCGDVVKIETRCRIPIWRIFGRIPWHVMPEPRITLHCTAIWWIHCHDSRATCHIAGCSHLPKSMSWSCYNQGVIIASAILKIVFRHILFYFVFLMQFGFWRAAAFVSSPIHLFMTESLKVMPRTTKQNLIVHTTSFTKAWQIQNTRNLTGKNDGYSLKNWCHLMKYLDKSTKIGRCGYGLPINLQNFTQKKT